MGLVLPRLFLSKDENGEEGVAISNLPEGHKTLVVGTRFQVETMRRESHGDKEEQEEAYSKLKGKMMSVNAISKAHCSKHR